MAAQATNPLAAEFIDDQPWVPANKRNAVSCLNHYDRWCAARQLDPMAATRRDLKAYLAERAAEVGPATVRTHWRMLKAFYGWAATPIDAGGPGELAASPMVGIAGPRTPARPATTAARPDDVARLERHFPRTTAGTRNAAMVSLMFRSGLRVGELPPLDLAHLATRPDGHQVLMVPVTKTGEPRIVPIHPETGRYLKRYLRRRGAAAGPLFQTTGERGRDVTGRLTTRAIQIVVRRATATLGIHVAPHQLRRAFTSQYLRAGGDVLSLEIIGGWADHRMPRRYLADEEAAAAVDRYFDVMANPRQRRTG